MYIVFFFFFFLAGIPSATYDVMINEAYFKKCREKKHFMAFTILVVLSGVADKFEKKLDTENYVILKNRTVSVHEKYVSIYLKYILMYDITGNGKIAAA